MSGDPVDEGGQAVRTGFVQAMQTAAMTMNLLQRRGSEARSLAEFDRRTGESEARIRQDSQVHSLKVAGYQSRHENTQELHELERHYKTRQIERAEELYELERRIKQAVLDRGDADLVRRTDDTAADRLNKDDIHRVQRQNLIDRAGWEKQRHDLDVEYKTLLIEIRRRAAGFTETLGGSSDGHASAMRSAAAYAAAKSAAGLSDQHRGRADAFEERLAEDAGADGVGVVRTTVDDDPVMVDSVRDLAEELTFDIYVSHFGDVVLPELGPGIPTDIVDAEIVEIDEGVIGAEGASAIDAAIVATGVLDTLDSEIDDSPADATQLEHHRPDAGVEL